jgi:putative nucleotidyltransferase with HDIG domain
VKTLKALKLLQKNTKAEVYLVGGFVRDYLRNKKNDDLDIVVRKLSSNDIKSFLKQHGSCTEIALAISKDSFTTNLILFRAHGDKTIAQIVLPRRGKEQIANQNNTLRQDAKYRDFRINALYLPINYKSKEDVIDPTVGEPGLRDIQDKMICLRAAAEDSFEMSPIRLLRAISLAAVTDYAIQVGLLKAIAKNRDKILKVPAEVLQKELNKILLSKKPSRYLRLMNKVGLLQHVMPELARCVGVGQDTRYHKYDVFTHCVYTCDNTEPELTLRLAGLLHDVGKTETRKEVGGRVTFHKHEMASVKRTRAFLNRLRYASQIKEAVLTLVRLHMYHYTREYTDTAVRRFIKKADITRDNIDDVGNLPLFKLRQAERLGNGLKTEPVTQRQLDFEKRIKEVFERGGGLELKDLNITGHIIMEAFETKPGKRVGEILTYLLDRVQRDKKLNNRMDLIELALQHIRSRDHSDKVLKS